MKCSTPSCLRTARPGWAYCDNDARRVLRDAFSPTPTAESAPVLLGMGRTPTRRWRPVVASAVVPPTG